MREIRRTTCNRDCPDACSILAEVEEERVVRLRGDPQHPVTQGFLCYRTSHFLSQQYSPERIQQPWLRREGRLVPISWEEALDFAATELRRIRSSFGPEAIFHYRGGGSLGYLKALTDLFFERFGPCTVTGGNICNGAAEAAQHLDFGDHESNDIFDIENAKSILLWGKNVYTSSPHSIPVLKRAREKGATLTLIDPLHHDTAKLCDRYIQPRPGGDFALAMAVSRVLLDEGQLASARGEWCDGLEAWERLVRRRTVEAWAAQADVTRDEVSHVAAALTNGAPCTLLLGWGLGRRYNGGTTVRALDALGAVTGNIGCKGAGVSFNWGRRKPGDFGFLAHNAPRAIPEPLFGPAILEASDPPVRAVWVTAANPLVMLPASGVTEQALRSLELLVVVDSWWSDTAKLATLVLPTTTLLEADDVVASYGHHYVGVARPVVPPPAGARSDLEIFQALASRVGLGDVLEGSAREWQARIVEPKLKTHGITLLDLEQKTVRSPLAAKVAFEGRRFPTPSGRVRLLGDGDVDATHEGNVLDAVADEWPFELMSVSIRGAQASQWVVPLDGPLEATIHPDSAGDFSAGDIVLLESPEAGIPVRLRFDPRQRRDIVCVPKGGDHLGRRCANTLLQARLTDMGQGAALYDQRVRLRPLPAPLPR
ncbi:MAG: molybdopterin-dependent oxidoreductase [Myxococcota bacterium]